MILLCDIGNTHMHVGLANDQQVLRQADIPTRAWGDKTAAHHLRAFIGRHKITGACFCSVVPAATHFFYAWLGRDGHPRPLELGPKTLRGVGINYPRPETIGPDRLANAVAARHFYGAPVVVVDFGTAVTFDVVDRHGDYIGGIIAPGLSAMTDYLHEKTALLPRIKIRDTKHVIGKGTAEAMLIGAVHGYRGLIRELLRELRRELGRRRLPVIVTGGYASMMARDLPEILAVVPNLTLEGLRLVWRAHQRPAARG
jgi:type III pantothenate kinase